MPTVAGKKYAYTAKGKAAAKAAKKKKKKQEGRSVKTMGGKYVGSLGAPVKAIKVKPTPKSKEPKEVKPPKRLAKKKSDQTKQSAKRAKRKGRKAPGRPLTASEEAYFQGKRYA